ncbi:MAG TPA: HAMP domain-containing sensor histidine kinase, partial [Gemmataceae bacterium]|nr:HAMP domain-containing sensor histidine kinase [Gemmataceae bacterium]
WKKSLPEAPTVKYRFLKPNTSNPEYTCEGSELDLMEQFQKDEHMMEANRRVVQPDGDVVYNYYAAIRRDNEALVGGSRPAGDGGDKDLIALLKIALPTKDIEQSMHLNRAILIATALVTALLIMSGSYMIVRYIIVKPVKHLKEVSDAISAGELNVRSEIQTGDEFEDLSHAFNRMLRNLVSMQDRLRKVNTDLDRKVDELAQANMALYESNRLKGDFLATMSHELRTPLNSILGFSEVLQSGDGLSDKQKRWVGNIQSSGERLLNLINDVLDLAKIEAGKMQVRLAAFSIYDVCEGLASMFRPMAEKKNIDLRVQLAPDVPVLKQDVLKLQQILSNLLSNAVKFTPEGGRVLLKAEAEGGDLVLTVSDTGVGIAPEEQELVFEKFRQAGNPLTREHAGTGLGLSIVRELCKLLGGEVVLHSDLGRGSTFTVRLPLERSEEPRLEFDLAHEGIDLSKAQRVDVRLYAQEAPVLASAPRPDGAGAAAPDGLPPNPGAG